MTRRAASHDYSRPGLYHITMHVAEGMGSPLGRVFGNHEAPDGHPDAPRVELSPIGQMVEQELLTAIPSRYPMAEVQDYVVMPEHLHFLLRVKSLIISPNGKRLPLGQVIAGFKKGCNKLYWEMTSNGGGQTATNTPVSSVSGGFPDRHHPSASQLDLCAAGRLLLVTPWRYQYRGKQVAITVPECKTMNCLAQTLCRTQDGWWKTSASADSDGGKASPADLVGGSNRQVS